MIASNWLDFDFNSLGNASPIVRRCLVLLLIFSFFMVTYWLDYSFLWERYSVEKDKAFALENEYRQYQNLNSTLPGLRKKSKEISKQVSRLTEKLPEVFEEALWLEEIATRGSAALVSIVGIKPLGEERQEDLLSKAFELKLQGNFSALYEFIRGLSFESRLTHFQDFSLKLEKNNADAIEMKLNLKIYALSAYQNPEANQPTTAITSSFSLSEELGNFLEAKTLNETLDPIPQLIIDYREMNKSIKDPFEMQEIEHEISNQIALCGEQHRNLPEPLEWFSLDALRFIGIIKQATQTWGLIRDNEGVIHRVQVGDKMGSHCGTIEKIEDKDLLIIERILDNNEWKTRNTRMHLS